MVECEFWKISSLNVFCLDGSNEKRITGGSQAEMAAKRPELHESDDISFDFCRIKRRHGDVSSHFSQDAKPSPSVVLATTS